jgi:hypothetical protein
MEGVGRYERRRKVREEMEKLEERKERSVESYLQA